MIRLALWLALCAAGTAAAQDTHVLVVTGLSGEPQYAARFGSAAAQLIEAARTRWGVRDENLTYLAERPDAAAGAHGKASREEVLAALAALGGRTRPDDVVLIVLLGHGSQQGADPRFSLPGPDLSAADLAAAVAPLDRQTVVVVNAASASGDFVSALSGPRRIIVTATRTGMERNATLFGSHFSRGLSSGDADADKDGRVSIAEAFVFARREVARAYETDRRLLTEHAQLDDNGDRIGSQSLDGSGDGDLARAVAFALAPDALAGDARAAPLLAERRRLETQVAQLRQRKATMDSAAYERDLEQLLVRLAETNQALRALEAKP